jgi:hypothetical protein
MTLTAELQVLRSMADPMLLKLYQKSIGMGQNTNLLYFVDTHQKRACLGKNQHNSQAL